MDNWAASGSVDVVRLLVEAGAEVNAKQQEDGRRFMKR